MPSNGFKITGFNSSARLTCEPFVEVHGGIKPGKPAIGNNDLRVIHLRFLTPASTSGSQTACRACHFLPITIFSRSLLSSSAVLAPTMVPSHSQAETTGLCLHPGSKGK
jgi:hypothetical protein